MQTPKGSGEEAINLFKGLVPLLNQWFEEKLGAVLPAVVPHAVGAAESTPREQSSRKLPKIKKKDDGATPGEEEHRGEAVTDTPEYRENGERWTQVLGRKERSKNKKSKSAMPAQAAKVGTIQANQTPASKASGSRPPLPTKGATDSKSEGRPPQGRNQRQERVRTRRPARRRPPRTAAVTLTCPPDMYSEVMKKARAEINLEEIGITALRPKRAITGALVLEVPGPEGVNRAKALKDKLQHAVGSLEGVKVARPVKTMDIRVKDVTEPTRTEEVRRALVAAGECDDEDVKVGPARISTNGLYTVWARCPIAAANKVIARGKLQVGWWQVRVEALKARPLTCYKCLEVGHVQARCRSTADRRNACYRCGQDGHRASDCVERPNCPVCASAGRLASHRVGGEAYRSAASEERKKQISEGPRSAVRGDPPPHLKGGIPSLLDRELPRKRRDPRTRRWTRTRGKCRWRWKKTRVQRSSVQRERQRAGGSPMSQGLHTPRESRKNIAD